MSSPKGDLVMKELELYCNKLNITSEEFNQVLEIIKKLLKSFTVDYSLAVLKMSCEDLKKEQEEITIEKENKEGIWADPVEEEKKK